MAIDLTGIIDWLKGWFYDKNEVNAYLNAKANKNLTNANMNVVTDASGNITTESKPVIPDVSGKIDTAGTGLSKSGTTLNHSNSITAQTSTVFKKIKYDAQGHITGTGDVVANDLPMHPHSTNLIIDTISQNYENLGITTMGATQEEINTAINTIIGNLSSFKAIEVVSTRPTASASTMNKLYIVSENSKVNVYYTKQSGSTYSWQKMDADILDELSINYYWSEIDNNPFSSSTPSSFAPASHNHGNLQSNGTIGNSADKVIITGGGGVLQAVSTIGATQVADINAHQNIGTRASATQGAINTAIDTAIGGKQDAGDYITSIALVPKSSDSTGAIRLYYGDEPSS